MHILKVSKSPKHKRKKLSKKISKVLNFLQWKKHQREFFKNVGIGVILALFLHLFLLHTSWGEARLNEIFDTYFLKREVKTAVATQIHNSKIVFITLNPKTGINQEVPLLTPRDQIARAIKIAADGDAKVIFPDVLLDTTDYQHPGNDALLCRVLLEISHRRDISLILPAEVWSNGTLKYNVFNGLINKSANIYRALPGVVASNKYESVCRYWREYEIIKSGKKSVGLLWGVPLLAAVLVESEPRELAGYREAIINGKFKGSRLQLKNQKTISVAAVKEDLYLQRIRFSLIPADETTAGNLGPTTDIPYEYLHYKSGSNAFRDKIVIIGNSNPDFGDTHLTPVGKMPGMYVIGNAINTLLTGRQISGAPLWLCLCFDICIILFTAFFFTFIPVGFKILKNTNIEILVFLVIEILTFFFGYWIGYGLYFHYSIFLDSILLILLIEFIKLTHHIEEFIMNLLKNWSKGRKNHGKKVVDN